MAERAAPSPATARTRAGDGLLFLAALALLLLAIVLSFGIGPLQVPAQDVLRVVGAKLGLMDGSQLAQRDVAVVWTMRIPRALLGALVGASLAMAGTALQGLFGNPLADPGIVGVSQGAALGAVAAIVLGVTALGPWTVPLAAFVGGLVATSAIYMLARPGRGSGTATMLLVGIAIGALCSAVIGFFAYIADDSALQQMVFWQMGSLAHATWSQFGAVAPVFVIGGIALLLMATPLDMLALGERQARHLGLDVTRTRALLVALAALLVGSAVAFAGSIGFVGLVVPHAMRLLAGPRHGRLLPLSALAGALLVVVADTLARSLDPPSEIPLGLFTAAIGAPYFLWLVMRQRPGGVR